MNVICPECGTEYRPGFDVCFDCGVPLISEVEYQELAEERETELERYRNMDIVRVHSVQGQPEADLIKSLLESNGIESYTKGQAVQSVHPFTVDGLGEIRILVREEDAERARQIIQEFIGSQEQEES
jgi:hypothetical protein